ncbi:MAG: ATP-grasp domain-containing protein, partial [Acidobacteriota bacterium]
AKAWRANTADELRHFFAKARRQITTEETLLQEIIPGDGSQQVSWCAFFRNGSAHSTLTARRERQHPREFGRAATYVETIELPEIEELSERFLKAIGFEGLVEVEFKRDPRDGQYKLLDVNTRTWGFHTLGAAAGVDFPYLLFADRMGLSVPGCRAVPGIGWLRWLADTPVSFAHMLGGHVGVRSYLTSLTRTRIESVFSRHDPLPSLAELMLLPYLISKKYF